MRAPINTSVQMEQSEIVNSGFKQYITENAELIQSLPAEIR